MMSIDLQSEPEKEGTDEDTDEKKNEETYQLQQDFFEAVRLQKGINDADRRTGKKLMMKWKRDTSYNDCFKTLLNCYDAHSRYKLLHVLLNLVSMSTVSNTNVAFNSETANLLNQLIKYATKNATIVSDAVVSRALAKCMVILTKSLNSSPCDVIKKLLQNGSDDLHLQFLVTHILQQSIQYFGETNTTFTSQEINLMFDITLSMFSWKHVTHSTTNISREKSFEAKHLLNVIATIQKLIHCKIDDSNVIKAWYQKCLLSCSDCHKYLFAEFRYNNFIQKILTTLRKIITRIFATFNTPKTSILAGSADDIEMKQVETCQHIDNSSLDICRQILMTFQRQILNLIDYDDVDNALLSDVCGMIDKIVNSFVVQIIHLNAKEKQVVSGFWSHVSKIITFLNQTHKSEIFLDNNEWDLVTNALNLLQQHMLKFIKTRSIIEDVFSIIWVKQYKISVNNLLNATAQGKIKFNNSEDTRFIQRLTTFATVTQSDVNFDFLKYKINAAFNAMKQCTSTQEICATQIQLIWLLVLMRAVIIKDCDRWNEIYDYLKQWIVMQCDKRMNTITSVMLTDTVMETAVLLANAECTLWAPKVKIYEMLIQKVNNDILVLLHPIQSKCDGSETDAKSDKNPTSYYKQNNYLKTFEKTIELLKALIDNENSTALMLQCLNKSKKELLQRRYENLICSRTTAKQIETKIISLLTPIVLKLNTNKNDSIFVETLKQFNEQTNLVLTSLTNYNVQKNDNGSVMQRCIAVVHGLSSEKEGVNILIKSNIQDYLLQLLNYFRSTNEETKLLYLFQILNNIRSKISSISSLQHRLGVHTLISNVLESMVQTKCTFCDDIYIQMLNLVKLQMNMNIEMAKHSNKHGTEVLLNFFELLLHKKRGKIVFRLWKVMSVWVERILSSQRISDGELVVLLHVIEISLQSDYSIVRKKGRTIVQHMARLKQSRLKRHLTKSTELLIQTLKDKHPTDLEFKQLSNTLCVCLLTMGSSEREHSIWTAVQNYVDEDCVAQAKKCVVFHNNLLQNKTQLVVKVVINFFDEMSVFFCNQ